MSGLSARNLSSYGANGAALVSDVSFDLDAGAILAICGPNGAGKTTLLNLLGGLRSISHGDVLVGGQSLRSMSAGERARLIAVVGQHSQPDTRLSVKEYVSLGQMPMWAERSVADHAAALQNVMDLTQLTDLAQTPLGQLSGGESQRAHIARALAQSPRLLFLDEPTNHLDPDAKGRMLSLISGLNITVVMVLHDLVMIPEFATHVALVKDARLQAFGPAPDVLHPEAVQHLFGVEYLLLPHKGRQIPTLHIKKTQISHHEVTQ